MDSASSTHDHTYYQNASASHDISNDQLTNLGEEDTEEDIEEIEWIGVDNISLNTASEALDEDSVAIKDKVFISTMD